MVQRCRQGDAAALGDLRDRFHGVLAGILISHGATPTESEDTLADLWADCVPGADDSPSLLERFGGNGPIQAWLARVAINRWVDRKRRQMREQPVLDGELAGADERASGVARDSLFLVLLRDCLQSAFARCAPNALVLLRLRYLHGVTQRELGRMMGWSEFKVSRFLSHAMEQIEADSLRELKQREPWLQLTWQDFLDLCETMELDFL